MDKLNHLDEVPLANLTNEQLDILQKAEQTINEQEKDVYLIAFKKN